MAVETPDPNWFYSTLAQSAAAIVGLFGALLLGRLFDQRTRAREQWDRRVPALTAYDHDVRDLVKRIERTKEWIDTTVRHAREARDRGETQLAVGERFLITAKGPAQVEDLSHHSDCLWEALGGACAQALTVLAGIPTTRFPSPNKDLQRQRDALFATCRDRVEARAPDANEYATMQRSVEDLLNRYEALLRSYREFRQWLVPRSLVAGWFGLAVLSGLSIIWPLTQLAGFRLELLGGLALGLALLLFFLGHLVYDLWSIGRL